MSRLTQKLASVPISLIEANDFVREYHRHHKPVVGHKFSIGAALGDKIVGVVIVGRPVSRHRDDSVTLEVSRLCTDGTSNACSFLYGTAWRAARALGYQRLGTYTMPSEGGGSLRAAGWKVVSKTSGRSWHSQSRPRVDTHPLGQKLLWEINDRVLQ